MRCMPALTSKRHRVNKVSLSVISASKKLILTSWVLASSLSGCALIPYTPKPIEPKQVTDKIVNKDPLSAEFKAFCIAQGYPENKLPFASWGIEELTLSALYHHTRLDLAKAQLGVAKAAIESAGIKTSPNLGAHVARSNRANGDINPFSYSLNVDIPIETTTKRAIRIEEAQHLAEVARLDVAETGWSLRRSLKQDWLNYHEHQAQTTLLESTAKHYDKLAELVSKRVQHGLASSIELAPILAQQSKARTQLSQAASRKDLLITTMATDAGLTKEKFQQIPIAQLELDSALDKINEFFASPSSNQLQSDALLNRIDIRRSLAKYAAAESKIKLEVAKQTPDISISPGFLFEFGDKIWSLGFSSLLNLLNKNPALIHQAERLREVEGAQFEAIQAQVISDVAHAQEQLDAAKQMLARAHRQKNQLIAALQNYQKQFDAGQMDKLEFTQAQLQYSANLGELMTAQFNLLRAAEQLENSLQNDLQGNLWGQYITTETMTR